MRWRYRNPQLTGTAGMAPFEKGSGHERPSLLNLLFRPAAAKAWTGAAALGDSASLPSRCATSTVQGVRPCAHQSGQGERGSLSLSLPTTRLPSHFKRGATTFPLPRSHLTVTRPSPRQVLMVRRRSRSRDWGQPAPPVWPGGGGDRRRRRSCAGGAELERVPANMAASEQQLSEASAVFAPLPLSSGGGGSGSSSGSVPVLFCFSVFARPSTVPHGSGYEMLIQKFLSLYGDQLDMHRKFVVQLFSEEWSQYIDLPKGFLVNERCKLRLVPLQIQITTLGNLTPSSTVFFCCDMQERFRPAIKYFGDIISVSQRLLQGAWILGIPVIVTEQYPKGLGSTVQEIDLTGAKLVLHKTKFSMVLPEVEAAIAEIPGIRSVVLFGVETHVCIQQTALELVGRGLEVHIVADATSSRSMMDRMFALERLARTGIIVTTSEAVLLQLIADKDHPKFKEIQNLIKASAPESGLLSKV